MSASMMTGQSMFDATRSVICSEISLDAASASARSVVTLLRPFPPDHLGEIPAHSVVIKDVATP